MPTTSELAFELERRLIIFHKDTSLPDDSQLGYTGDPNNAVNGATAGQTLLYNCPSGTFFLDKSQNPHEVLQKVQDGAAGLLIKYSMSSGSATVESTDTTVLASTDIGGGRVVIVFNNSATYADNTTNYFGQMGITLNAASPGASLKVRLYGVISDVSFNFTNGPLYLSNNGLITQIEPITNASVVLGYPKDSNSFLFDPQTIIER